MMSASHKRIANWILCAALGLAAQPAFSAPVDPVCPKVVRTDNPVLEPMILDLLKNVAIDTIVRHDHSTYRRDWLKVSVEPSPGNDSFNMNAYTAFTVLWDKGKTGSANTPIFKLGLSAKKKTLVFDFETFQPKRGHYESVMSGIMMLYPWIEYLPARMKFDNSQSARAWLKSFMGDMADLGRFKNLNYFNQLKSAQVKALRDQVIAAYGQIPAGKVRQRAGFNRLTFFRVIPDQGGFEFVARRGEPSEGESPRVIFDSFSGGQKKHVELFADGTWKLVTDVVPQPMEHYNQMHEW